MEIKTVIERVGVLAAGKANKRAQNQLMRQGLQLVLEFWHQTFLQKHFASPAAVEARYPGVYAKRSKRYQQKKARLKGHTRVNEWSGRTRRALSQSFRLSGTRKKANLVMDYPSRKVERAGGGWATISARRFDDEITAINSQEDRQMARFFLRWFTSKLKRLGDKEIVKVSAARVTKQAA